MSSIHGEVTTRQAINGSAKTSSAVNGELNNNVNKRVTQDYNQLTNKPSIEGVTLVGNKLLGDFGIPYVYFDTTENWSQQITLVSKQNAIYVYTDHIIKDGVMIPGFKVGDGNAYVVDLPFSDAPYMQHIMDTVIHITQEEREFWNDKVTAYIDPEIEDRLIITKDKEE